MLRNVFLNLRSPSTRLSFKLPAEASCVRLPSQVIFMRVINCPIKNGLKHHELRKWGWKGPKRQQSQRPSRHIPVGMSPLAYPDPFGRPLPLAVAAPLSSSAGTATATAAGCGEKGTMNLWPLMTPPSGTTTGNVTPSAIKLQLCA